MKPVKEMNADELMQLIAAVSLRISALVYGISATRYVFLLGHRIESLQPAISRGQVVDSYSSQTYAIYIGFDLLISVILFSLSVSLSRLLCRGLIEVLHLTGTTESPTSKG